MRIIVSVINNNQVLEHYDYSNLEFLCNGNLIQIKDKNILLVSLISKTTKWKSEDKHHVSDGYVIRIDMEDYYKEYYFQESIPENFIIFLDQVRNIVLEEN